MSSLTSSNSSSSLSDSENGEARCDDKGSDKAKRSEDQEDLPPRSDRARKRHRVSTSQSSSSDDEDESEESDTELLAVVASQRKAGSNCKKRAPSWRATRKASRDKKPYKSQFLDDRTGNRYIHPSALRFTLKLMEEEAQRTAHAVAQRLRENGEAEESRKVEVRSTHHVKSITTRVRKRLREVLIPSRYTKVEDINMPDLPVTNQQRQQEIDANQRLLQKLEQQHEVLQKEYEEAKEKRDRILSERDACTKQPTGDGADGFHPLLEKYARQQQQQHSSSALAVPSEDRFLKATRRPDGPTFSMLLKSLSSPYDDDESIRAAV